MALHGMLESTLTIFLLSYTREQILIPSLVFRVKSSGLINM